MKILACGGLLSLTGICFAVEPVKILATTEWSEPVTSLSGQSLRARMVVTHGPSPASEGAVSETGLYVELQNVSAAVGSPMRLYWDPREGLRCEIKDADGKSPGGGGFGSGGRPGPCWITLPYDSSIRLRANMFGHGRTLEQGLVLTVSPTASWTVPIGDGKKYFLTGTIAFGSPGKEREETHEKAWEGTLVIPKVEIGMSNPHPKPR